MSFNSVPFIIYFSFVIVFMSLFNIKKLQKYKLHALLVLSALFYCYWSVFYFLFLFGLIILSYISIKLLKKNKNKKVFVLSLLIPISCLFIFKYYNFFIDSFSKAFNITNINTLNLIIPLGISFYTFQILSILIDTYKGKFNLDINFIEYSLLISFFPKMIAGPIVDNEKFINQLRDEDRRINFDNFKEGLQIFLFGLFKKIVIADNIVGFVNVIYDKPKLYNWYTILLAIIAYSIELYCDSSGYADMAVGCGKILGYDLPKNFNLPYISKNISEFWKRWHISLSTWLQKYLYISLGGNRKGELRTYINLFLTMLIGGLWHGASWNFILWGAIHGLALCIHKIYSKRFKMNNFLAILITYLYICLTWVLFKADTLSKAIEIYKCLFMFNKGISFLNSWAILGIIFVLIGTLYAYKKAKVSGSDTINGIYYVTSLDSIFDLFVLFVFVCIIICLAYTGSNPFIYFAF